jgi:hypothetical protein
MISLFKNFRCSLTMIIYVARLRRRNDRPLSCILYIWQIWGDKEFLSFIHGKQE